MAESKIQAAGHVFSVWKSGNFSFNGTDVPMDISVTVPIGSYIVALTCNVQLGNNQSYPRMYLTANGTRQQQYAAIMVGAGATQAQMVLVKMITVTESTTFSGALTGDGNSSLFEGRQIEAIKIA